MTVGVMQPYLFPHLGYFQLLSAVDDFWLYDDVQFIKQGYINRNRLLFGPFTVPLRAAPHGTIICERQIAEREFAVFRKKWYRSFELAYRNAPHHRQALHLARMVWDPPTSSIAEQAERSLRVVSDYLGIPTPIRRASEVDYNRRLTGQERLLDLLTVQRATTYVNSPGGRSLYQAETFDQRGIRLRFIQPFTGTLSATANNNLSILHLIAHHPQRMLSNEARNGFTLQS